MPQAPYYPFGKRCAFSTGRRRTQVPGNAAEIPSCSARFDNLFAPQSRNRRYLAWGLKYPVVAANTLASRVDCDRKSAATGAARVSRPRGQQTVDSGHVRIEVHPEHPEPRKIRRAAEALRAGEVIGYPTDTVYALGCDPLDRKALERLHQIKRMPKSQPLALVCADLSQVAEYAQLDNGQFRLLRRVLPGPYCFILLATRETPRVLHLRERTVGVRVPSSPVAIALVRELGHPIISTTAAHHGDPPPLDAADVAIRFPRIEVVLDAGPCGPTPSTVVDLSKGEIEVLREGAGPLEALD